MALAKQKDSRFTKDHWIEKALEVLSQTGGAKIHIEKLAAKLGVTKGSFYWHFESRNDFVDQVLDYWDAHSSQSVIEFMREHEDKNAKDALIVMTNFLIDQDQIRHDMPVRSWAVQETRVQTRVEETDIKREQYIISLLTEDGSYDEFNARNFANIFNCYARCHAFVLPTITPEELRERLLWLIDKHL